MQQRKSHTSPTKCINFYFLFISLRLRKYFWSVRKVDLDLMDFKSETPGNFHETKKKTKKEISWNRWEHCIKCDTINYPFDSTKCLSNRPKSGIEWKCDTNESQIEQFGYATERHALSNNSILEKRFLTILMICIWSFILDFIEAYICFFIQ